MSRDVTVGAYIEALQQLPPHAIVSRLARFDEVRLPVWEDVFVLTDGTMVLELP